MWHDDTIKVNVQLGDKYSQLHSLLLELCEPHMLYTCAAIYTCCSMVPLCHTRLTPPPPLTRCSPSSEQRCRRRGLCLSAYLCLSVCSACSAAARWLSARTALAVAVCAGDGQRQCTSAPPAAHGAPAPPRCGEGALRPSRSGSSPQQHLSHHLKSSVPPYFSCRLNFS